MSLDRYLAERRDAHLAELLELLRIPSISTLPERAVDMRAAAEFVRERLAAAGFSASLRETPGHPVVYAERTGRPGPTVLVYGHYDVQPADPVEEWTRPPFEPVVEDGVVWARGASDDKGQFYAHVKGAEAAFATDPDLPLNVKFLIEGEEEIGSPNLDAFIADNLDLLSADAVVVSDGAMIAPDTPTLTYGLRGLSYIEVRVRTSSRDLHSGAYGGGVPNPINALARMIAALHDDQGRVAVPGFYDAVREVTPAERELLAQVPFDERRFLGQVGVSASPGERGYTLLERIWTRPTLDVNGIGGGFQGEGSKTVIPQAAMAKISCRLVPDQDPAEITRLLREHLERLAPPGVEVEVREFQGGHPAITALDSPAVEAASQALAEVYGRAPVFVRTGGSIPVVSTFQRLLGAPVVLLDLGLETDNLHAPDEHFHLADYHRGIHTSARLLQRLGRAG